MERRNTVQKELVLNAVLSMRRHVTAEEVYEQIRREHPSVGKGTVYRNLGILAQEEKIRRVEIPDGADCFDFTPGRHYHVRCVSCGKILDVDMDAIEGLEGRINDGHGIEFLDYDILFKGICPDCRKKAKEEQNE